MTKFRESNKHPRKDSRDDVNSLLFMIDGYERNMSILGLRCVWFRFIDLDNFQLFPLLYLVVCGR